MTEPPLSLAVAAPQGSVELRERLDAVLTARLIKAGGTGRQALVLGRVQGALQYARARSFSHDVGHYALLVLHKAGQRGTAD
eukprot:358264-Chlamydomonas_euryale.AAC.2